MMDSVPFRHDQQILPIIWSHNPDPLELCIHIGDDEPLS